MSQYPFPEIYLISFGLALVACPGYHTLHPFDYRYL